MVCLVGAHGMPYDRDDAMYSSTSRTNTMRKAERQEGKDARVDRKPEGNKRKPKRKQASSNG